MILKWENKVLVYISHRRFVSVWFGSSMESEDEDSYDDSGNESCGYDDMDYVEDDDLTNEKKGRELEQYPFQVLTSKQILQYMNEFLQEVNNVVKVSYYKSASYGCLEGKFYLINLCRCRLQPLGCFWTISDGTRRSLWRGFMMETRPNCFLKHKLPILLSRLQWFQGWASHCYLQFIPMVKSVVRYPLVYHLLHLLFVSFKSLLLFTTRSAYALCSRLTCTDWIVATVFATRVGPSTLRWKSSQMASVRQFHAPLIVARS